MISYVCGESTYAASAMACRFDVGCGKNKAIFNASHSVNRFAPDGNRSIFKFMLNLIYVFVSFLDFPLISFFEFCVLIGVSRL